MWDGTNWTQVSTPTSPPARSSGQIAYDASAEDMVMFGGGNASGVMDADTWTFDGTTWTAATGIASPSARDAFGLAYVPLAGDDELVLFGGDGARAGFQQTWVASHDVFTITRQVCPTATPASCVDATTAAAATYSKGQAIGYVATVGNPASYKRNVNNFVITLPPGVAPTGVALSLGIGTTPATQPCTALTTPSCTFVGNSVSVTGVSLASGASQSVTAWAIVRGADVANPSPSCSTTGVYNGGSAQAAFYGDQILADRPMAYYRLGETSGTSAADASGNGHGGSYNSVQLGSPGAVNGDANTAVSFNSPGQAYVSLPANTFNNFTGGFTFEAWVNPSISATSQHIFDFGNGVTTDEIYLTRNAATNGVTFGVANTSTTKGSISAPDVLRPAEWQDIAVTETATGVATIYRNGVAIASGTLPVPTNPTGGRTNAWIGRSPNAGDSYFYGSIDEVAIASTALGSDRLLAHWQAGSAATAGSSVATAIGSAAAVYHNVVAADLASGWWRLGEASGTSAVDESGNAATGTYAGTPSYSQAGTIADDPSTAVGFNGTPTRVLLPSGMVNTSSYGSVEAWVKTTGTSEVIVGMNTAAYSTVPTGYTPVLFVDSSGFLRGELWTGTAAPLISTIKVNDGKWHHVAITSSLAGTEALYLDGAQAAVKTGITPTAVATQTVDYIGLGYISTGWGSAATAWKFFNGTIDEPAIWKQTVLTATQIAAHYNAGHGVTAKGAVTASVAPLNICDTRLGNEAWWNYVTRSLGSGGTASVNVANGNLVLTQLDSTPITAHGHLGFELRRSYNSLDSTLLTLPDSMGAGWQLNIGQADDLIGAGVGADALYVPAALESVAQPLAVTLIDRDGTRHVFTPRALASPLNATGLLAPRALPVGAGSVCVDQLYTAPPGVHLSLWRYVQFSQAGCAGTTSVLGFAAERPDRLRYEFAATGELLDLTDHAGVELRYVYDGQLVGLGTSTAALGHLRAVYEPTAGCSVTGTGAGLTLTTASLAQGCRYYHFVYSDDLASVITGAGFTTCAVPTGVTSATCIDDPAGRRTTYGFDGSSPLPNGLVSTVEHLTLVQNPDGTTLHYSYNTGCSTNADQLCSATDLRNHATAFTYAAPPAGDVTRPVLSLLTDRRSIGTAFNYGTGTSTVVDTAPDSSTNAAACSGNAACHRQFFQGIDGAGRVAEIDMGLGTATTTGASTGPWQGVTLQTWDTPAAACRQPDTLVDNNLCVFKRLAENDSETGQSNGISTPDETTTYTYNVDGAPLSTSRQLTYGASPTYLTTTYGYRLQYHQPSGVVYCADWTVAGNGTTSYNAPGGPSDGGCTAATNPDLTSTVYRVDDLTQTLDARGNSAAAFGANPPGGLDWHAFITDFLRDNTASAQPNTSGASVCATAGRGTGNTGLLCETDAPGSLDPSVNNGQPVAPAVASLCTTPADKTTIPSGSGGTLKYAFACGRSTYNGSGEKLTQLSPKAAVDGGNPAQFTYYADTDKDASGNVSAGGWLKAVTDPNGQFVVFAYDRAGNVLRAWDRNATSANLDGQGNKLPITSYGNTTTTGTFVESDHGPYPNAPTGSTAASAPWRYLLVQMDQVGDKTQYLVDANGNDATICKPREFTAEEVAGHSCTSAPSFAVTQQFDNSDETVSVTQPIGDTAGSHAGTTAYGYDGFGNQASVTGPGTSTDPAGKLTLYGYDALNHRTTTRWDRSTTGHSENSSTNCPTGDAAFPSGDGVCAASQSYDGVDNLVKSQDANGHTSSRTYDAVHRALTVVTPRNVTNADTRLNLATVTSASTYDEDGNVTNACSGREFSEGSGSCTATSVYATHNTYDAANRVTASVKYRDASHPLTSYFGYDEDGNATSTTSPRGASAGDPAFTTTTAYDDTDRKVTRCAPRSCNLSLQPPRYTMSWRYDGSGDVITQTGAPAADGTVRRSAYSFDAAHRVLDTVVGADNQTASAAGMADVNGGSNVRTRNRYDADGNVIGVYNPRAFTIDPAQPTHDYVSAPRSDFLVQTRFDADDRPIATYVPRTDTTDAPAPSPSVDQSSQCPALTSLATPLIGYPSTTGVCTTSVKYDAAGDRSELVEATTDSSHTNRYIDFTYTDDGLLATVNAPNPAVDGQRLDGSSNPYAARYTYDGDGKPTHVFDALGRDTTTVYTSDELVYQTTQPALTNGGSNVTHVTTTYYDAAGGTGAVIDAAGHTSTWTYYADGRPADVTDGGGNDTHYAYDLDGNATATFSPNQVAANTSAVHAVTVATGSESSGTAAAATLASFTGDELLATMSKPLTADGSSRRTTTYGYDPAGRKTSAQVTVVNRPATVDGTDGGTQTFVYYADDRLNSVTGKATTSTNTTVTGTQTFSYNAAGGQTLASDTTGAYHDSQATSATYYLDGLPDTVNDGSATSTYSYDGAGNITTRDNGKGATTYHYGDAGLLTSESPANITGSYSLTYDTVGRGTQALYPDNETLVNSWNTDDTLNEQTLKSSNAATTADWSYGTNYDGLYRVLSQTFSGVAAAGSGQLQTGTDTFAYDAANRLTHYTVASSTVAGNCKAVTVAWDHDGNRTNATQDTNPATDNGCTNSSTTASFTYNADDSIASGTDSAGTSHTYTYDAAGRLELDGCSTNNYDGFDRLVRAVASASCGAASTTTYSYDALDRQRTDNSVVGSATTNYSIAYDGLSSAVSDEQVTQTGASQPLPPDTAFDLSAQGVPQATTAGSTARFLTGDGNGNVSTISSTGGTTPDCTARFDPFGVPRRGTTSPDNDPNEHVCNTGSATSDIFYRGGRHDGVTNTYQFGTRTYDPSKSAFLTADGYAKGPSSADLSVVTDPLTSDTYSYVNGDPMNFADPDGHMACDADGPCGGAHSAVRHAQASQRPAWFVTLFGMLLGDGSGSSLPPIGQWRYDNLPNVDTSTPQGEQLEELLRSIFRPVKPGDAVGSGSATDAAAYELATGQPIPSQQQQADPKFHIQKVADIYRGLIKLIPKLSGKNADIARELGNSIQDALQTPDATGVIGRLDPNGKSRLQKLVDSVRNSPRFFVATQPDMGLLGDPGFDPLPDYVLNPPVIHCSVGAGAGAVSAASCASPRLPENLPYPAVVPPLNVLIYPMPLPELVVPEIPGFGGPIFAPDLVF
jgi:RHS repeat-associated protein